MKKRVERHLACLGRINERMRTTIPPAPKRRLSRVGAAVQLIGICVMCRTRAFETFEVGTAAFKIRFR